MSKYPDWSVGLDVSAANLAAPIPAVYVKSANQSRASTTTFADDSELSGIPLGVGTYWVKLHGIGSTDTATTPKLKTIWAFTGTWTAARWAVGPASSNTAARTAVTPLNMGTFTAASTVTYGFAASTAGNYFTEESLNVVVTVAGNLSLQWAQSVSDASNTTILAGSAFIIRQLA